MENIHGTLGAAQQGTIQLEYMKGLSLPKVIELVVPTPFLKPTAVDGADAIVDAVDTDFIGPESDNVAVLDVSGMYGAVFLVSESFYEDPKGGEWGGGMCVGDFGKWGDEGGIDDISVNYEGDDTESDYGGYRKHFEMSIRTQFSKQIQYGICICLYV